MSVLSKTALKAQYDAMGAPVSRASLKAVIDNMVDSYQDTLPQLTTAQILALTPTLNQLVYNTDKNYIMQYNGAGWIYLVAMFIGTTSEVNAAANKAGQIYFDTDTNSYFLGAPSGKGQVSILGDCCGQFNYFLFGENKTSLPNPITASVRNLNIEYTSLASLTGALKECDRVILSFNSALVSISLTTLESVFSLTIGDNDLLETINLSGLKFTNRATVSSNPLLTSINLSAFENTNGLEISSNDIIESISIAALTYAKGILVSNNAALETITANSNLACPNQDYTGNALLEATVDNLLDIADNSGVLNGIFAIEGGTNAAPSVAGLASKSNLVGKGWTVTNN